MCTLISDKMDFKNNTRKKEGHFIMIKVHKCQYIRKIFMYVCIYLGDSDIYKCMCIWQQNHTTERSDRRNRQFNTWAINDRLSN